MNEEILAPGNYRVTFKANDEEMNNTIWLDDIAMYGKKQIPAVDDNILRHTRNYLIQSAYETLPVTGEAEKLPLADYEVKVEKVG
ncbi:hypothetical protein [Gluconobacter sp. Dm-44]|uniref:hypothetical protein n=1 Tax=Gluconobacter sp. Dm-44 TaxID=2799805 RepID=UPI001B8BD106|nr:hypothetical protein [Gluconobacter sp. Dm-44]MBS1060751.1 hypothetical protein [Gluconobacter sp. Dm-44]